MYMSVLLERELTQQQKKNDLSSAIIKETTAN